MTRTREKLFRVRRCLLVYKIGDTWTRYIVDFIESLAKIHA